MSTSYIVPTSDKTLGSVKSTVLATGVAFLFVYLCHYAFHLIVTFVIDMEDKDRNKVKQKLLETSRVLYLYIICTMVSIYPPFYYGPHSAIMAWITLIIVILMHVFCIYGPSCKGRSAWAILSLIYHLAIAVWIFLILVVGYTWSNQQTAAIDQ